MPPSASHLVVCPALTLFSSITYLCLLPAHTITWVMLCGLCREPQYDAYLQGMAYHGKPSSRRAWGNVIHLFFYCLGDEGSCCAP